MAIFHAYCDESGKKGDHPVVTFSGLCLPHAKLASFDLEWEQLLRRIAKPSLHMARATRLSENYGPTMPRRQTPVERVDALQPFAECIRRNFELGIMIAVEVRAFNALSPMAKRALGNPEDPYHLSFLRGVIRLDEHLQLDNDYLLLVCDDDQETAWDCHRFYRAIRKSDKRSQEKLIGLCFADDKHFPSLQAADMLAFLFRLEARRVLFGEGYVWSRLFNQLTLPTDGNSAKWVELIMDHPTLDRLSGELEKINLPKGKKIR